MVVYSRTLRWVQIVLTLFYGQILSTAIFQYIIQGICGLILHLRPTYDSILLIVLGIFMLAFVLYAIHAVWYCRMRMSTISLLILISILILTSLKSFVEIINMGQRPTRTEWILIRIIEIVLRVFGIAATIMFILRLRQGYKPEDF